MPTPTTKRVDAIPRRPKATRRDPDRYGLEISGEHRPLGRATLEKTVRLILARERAPMSISIAFIGDARMRRLASEWKGTDRPTDVIAFSLSDPNGRHGDIYIGRPAARRSARRHGVSLREELLRLVIHGLLHAIGYDHPEDDSRLRSPMWRRQERYLAWII